MLAALVPERVLPFGSGDSRKRGPKPSRGQSLGVVPRWGAERRGRRRFDPAPLREEAMVLAAYAGRLFFCGGAETSGAPIGAPPPFFWEARRAFLKRAAKLGCEAASRERGRIIRPRGSGGGGPREAWWRGPLEMELRCRCRRIVGARAPSTAQGRGPPSPLSRGRKDARLDLPRRRGFNSPPIEPPPTPQGARP